MGTTRDPAELAECVALLDDEERLEVREYWERVIDECRAEVMRAPRATSALLDGSAGERRRRRMERRAVAAVVRELPLHRVVSGPGGREVA